MIEFIEFSNFKALRQTTLPLAPFTLILGPNGSGKSSVLQAIQAIAVGAGQSIGIAGSDEVKRRLELSSMRSISVADQGAPVIIQPAMICKNERVFFKIASGSHLEVRIQGDTFLNGQDQKLLVEWLSRMKVFSLDFSAIAKPNAVNSRVSLQPNGEGLSAVLDELRSTDPERWDLLLAEMRRWLPEYDYILFENPKPGEKSIVLRTKKGGHRIPARDLSQGTLVALALLTLAYLPDPPSLIALEEIDRGLHPRLLRHLQDALYRLSYPESCGEKREPIQVIATTHSPYLLDLYRDHPEEVVLAQKEGLEVQFKRLSDIEHFQDILGDAPLSDIWYSGVLGGVSVQP